MRVCVHVFAMRNKIGTIYHTSRVDKRGKKVSNSSIPACKKQFLKYKVHLHMFSTTT